MRDIDLIDANFYILEVFKSFKILDEIPLENHPEFYRFTKIVFNYMAMERKLKEENK